MSLFGLAKSQPAEPAQKGQFLKWPPEHFTVVYTLWAHYVNTMFSSKTKFSFTNFLCVYFSDNSVNWRKGVKSITTITNFLMLWKLTSWNWKILEPNLPPLFSKNIWHVRTLQIPESIPVRLKNPRDPGKHFHEKKDTKKPCQIIYFTYFEFQKKLNLKSEKTAK